MHPRLINLKEFADYPVIRRVLPRAQTAHFQPAATCIDLDASPSLFKVPAVTKTHLNTTLPAIQEAENMIAIALEEKNNELIHEDYGSFDLVMAISENCNRSFTTNLYIPKVSKDFIGSLLILDHVDELIIDRINVQHRYRKMGFGKKLVDETIGYLKRTLKHPVLVQAPVEDEGCEKFFQKCGFELWLKSASLRIADSDLHQTEFINA